MTEQLTEVKGTDAGFTGDDQIRVVLHRIIERGGSTDIQDLNR